MFDIVCVALSVAESTSPWISSFLECAFMLGGRGANSQHADCASVRAGGAGAGRV